MRWGLRFASWDRSIVCENSCLSSFLAVRDVLLGGTSAPQRNTATPHWWSKISLESGQELRFLDALVNLLLLLFTNDRQQTNDHKGETKMRWIYNTKQSKSQSSWNIYFFRRSIWVLLELVRRRTQNVTIIDQEKHKIEQIYVWNPL